MRYLGKRTTLNLDSNPPTARMGMDCCRLSGTLFIVIFCTFVVELEVNTKPPQPQSNNEQCPENQMYRSNMTICGSTCSTNDFRQQCPKETTTFDGRVCVPGMVMLPNGTCLHPNLCPCAFDGQLYYPHEKVSVGCVNYVCSKRRWTVLSDRNCKRRCRAFGDQHYITFDDFKYSFQFTCEHTLVKYQKLFQVTASNLPCGNTGVTCKAIRVKTHGAEIELMGKMKTTINREQVMQTPKLTFNGGVLFQTDLSIVLLYDLGFDIYWDGGTSVTIALSTEYSGQVGGLCFNFDVVDNDVVDTTCGLLACMGQYIQTPCDRALPRNVRFTYSAFCHDSFKPRLAKVSFKNNTKRKDRALESCAIIREGELFAACRKIIDTAEDFYQRCLVDSCGCRCVEGGNCRCFCTTVATFARECVLKCVQWRNTNLCPTMCESGKVYKACAKPCKKTCSNVALQPEPCCNQADHVEGCFCRKDYVENGNGVCVPLAQCPCSYSKGPGAAVQMFPAGETIDIDCRKCTCFNSTFVCEGNLCPLCLEDQFTCNSGDKCIWKTELCDGIYDCNDKSDEHPLNPNCESTTVEPCIPNLSIDHTTYKKSFEMTMENEHGTTYPAVSRALRYSNDAGFMINAEEDQNFTIIFIVTEKCPNNWRVDTIGLSMSGSKLVELFVQQKFQTAWRFHDSHGINIIDQTYDVPRLGNEYQLIFRSTSGKLHLTNIYMDLFCTCQQDSNPNVTSVQPTPPTDSTTVPAPCPSAVDLAFVVDSSGSICNDTTGITTCPSWDSLRTFMANLVEDMVIGDEDYKIAVVVFESSVRLKWDLNKYTNKSLLLDDIKDLTYFGGNTNTIEALDSLSNVFSEKNGDRPNVKNTAILITDGKPRLGHDKYPIDVIRAAVNRVTVEWGIQLLAVGVTESIDMDTLKELSSPPHTVGETVYLVKDFKSLGDIRRQLQRQNCLVSLNAE